MIPVWATQERNRADACDIVVVGGGLVGALTAARLAGEGFDTAVLEAQEVAAGATGCSAGFVVAGLPGHYNWMVATYGEEQARELWAMTAEGRDRLVDLAEKLMVPVERTGSLRLAVDDAEAQSLEESVVLLGEAGFRARFQPTDPLERGFRAVAYHGDDAIIDPVRLTKAVLADANVAAHPHTEVYSLQREDDGLRVWARGRNVLCDAVVLATNGYSPLFDTYFTGRVIPARGLSLVADSGPDTPSGSDVALDRPALADYGYEFCRRVSQRRLLLGGWRRPEAAMTSGGEEDDLEDQTQKAVDAFAARYFPDVTIDRSNRSSGMLGLTEDGLPLIGSLPAMPRVYFGVGLGGRGLSWAPIVSQRLIELMLRDTDPGLLSADRI